MPSRARELADERADGRTALQSIRFPIPDRSEICVRGERGTRESGKVVGGDARKDPLRANRRTSGLAADEGAGMQANALSHAFGANDSGGNEEKKLKKKKRQRWPPSEK